MSIIRRMGAFKVAYKKENSTSVLYQNVVCEKREDAIEALKLDWGSDTKIIIVDVNSIDLIYYKDDTLELIELVKLKRDLAKKEAEEAEESKKSTQMYEALSRSMRDL